MELSPLAKPKRGNPTLTERFELFARGRELANAFSELNDPHRPAARASRRRRGLRAAGDEEAAGVDEDYLRAMEYGMPPMGGVGIGIDRLFMYLTNTPNIRDVILFPTLRPGMSRLELSIAWRYLRSRRGSKLLSLISVIAIGGVAVGVSALIVIMGVMNGLQNDLREKILIGSPDVRVLNFGEDMVMTNWEAVLAKTREGAGRRRGRAVRPHAGAGQSRATSTVTARTSMGILPAGQGGPQVTTHPRARDGAAISVSRRRTESIAAPCSAHAREPA